MSKVKNQKMIKLLAQRELRTSKRMNIVLILSVVLTCVMFTCIASVGGNLMLALRNQTMRMVGGDHVAGLKYVLPADYEKVLADGKTKDVVYRIIVGRAINEDFQSFGVELHGAGDDRAAQLCWVSREFADLYVPIPEGRFTAESYAIRKSRRVSPFSIAKSNMVRRRKKTITVILSLTLSMTLFVLVVTAVRSLPGARRCECRSLLRGSGDAGVPSVG